MLKSCRTLFFGFVFTLLFPCICFAASNGKDQVPSLLEPWKSWVLYDEEQQLCPARYNNGDMLHCKWPSRLEVDINDTGGSFKQKWLVYAPTWAPLPGDRHMWPDRVMQNNKPVPVVLHDGRPSVKLEPGSHEVIGVFSWSRKPEMMPIPPSTGIISLVVDRKKVDSPRRDASGRLWLSPAQGEKQDEDRIDVTVFRMISDDSPMQVTTLLRIVVSGRSREVHLENIFFKDSILMDIDGSLPATKGKNNGLTLQARPGRWDLRVTSRFHGSVNRLFAGNAVHGEEVWSFKAKNHLRMVKVKGGLAIDPTSTHMPPEWKSLPAWVLKKGEALSFKEIRRGDKDPAPNRLKLARTLWLDFDGKGFTIHDTITGAISRKWYLSMILPAELGRVSVDGKDRLITLQGEKKQPGVQLRSGTLYLEADARLEGPVRKLPATGWDNDFQNVSGVLNLPPGWRLFSVSGTDVPAGTWVQQWTLLDFFIVLIIAISAYKIRNRLTGVLALFTLVLIYHEPGAPKLVWIHILIACALLKYAPGGWLKKAAMAWGGMAFVFMVVTAVPFMIQQVRIGIYPQLELTQAKRAFRTPAPAKVAQPVMEERDDLRKKKTKLKKGVGKIVPSMEDKSAEPMQSVLLAYDPDAVIQTGPGLPTWKWRTIAFKWNGPVDQSQSVGLTLIPPWMNMILGFLRVILIAGLALFMLDISTIRKQWPMDTGTRANGKTVAGAICFLLLLAAPVKGMAANGGFPPAKMLETLKARLLEKPDCLPVCADISNMAIAAEPDEIQVVMQIHAATLTAIPLPAGIDTWDPGFVAINNLPATGLLRGEKGGLWVLMEKGVHKVVMKGKVPDTDEIRIPFPLKPHRVEFSGNGWKVKGLLRDGRVDAGIVLIRPSTISHDPAAQSASFAHFLNIERTLHLGLVWRTTTTVRRITPPGVPVVESIPLLKGESVTTPGIDVDDNKALVHFAPDEIEKTYVSALAPADAIDLKAMDSTSFCETWVLDAGPVWSVSLSGIPVIHHQDRKGNRKPKWRPWPGETVRITIKRPKAVSGKMMTIDAAKLDFTPGKRFAKSVLTLDIRSSRGGNHPIEIPGESNLQIVKINGRSLPVRQDGNIVSVPLQPGRQNIAIEWRQRSDATLLTKGPVVKAGDSAVNATVSFHMPGNRWILFAGGPTLGPAVLFWSYLIIVILAAVMLSRIKMTPLTIGTWILLGMGLTQIPAPAALLIVCWLPALGLRGQKKMPENRTLFNLVQFGLAIWTLAAMIGIYGAIENGLLGIPDMQIAGNDSTRLLLNWTQDRIGPVMPTPWAVSLPLWSYRVLMLVWALWLAFSLIHWFKWGWGCFTKDDIWKKPRFRKKKGLEEGYTYNFEPEPDAPDKDEK